MKQYRVSAKLITSPPPPPPPQKKSLTPGTYFFVFPHILKETVDTAMAVKLLKNFHSRDFFSIFQFRLKAHFPAYIDREILKSRCVSVDQLLDKLLATSDRISKSLKCHFSIITMSL